MLTSQLVNVSSLEETQIQGMWRIFEKYYADISYERFLSDLADKDHVILLSAKHSVAGFSTIKVFREKFENRKITAIYSGDTIIDESYWGNTALQKEFYRFLVKTYFANLDSEVYWYLISKGYKTYCLLTRNCLEHWPRHDKPTPAFEKELMHRLSSKMFGAAWKPELGVLQFENPMGRLKNNVAPISDEMRAIPDIRFFEQSNPHHDRGDELCCLGKLDMAAFLYFPVKMVRKQLRSLQQRAPRAALTSS